VQYKRKRQRHGSGREIYGDKRYAFMQIMRVAEDGMRGRQEAFIARVNISIYYQRGVVELQAQTIRPIVSNPGRE